MKATVPQEGQSLKEETARKLVGRDSEGRNLKGEKPRG
jgi:hypothetical protein